MNLVNSAPHVSDAPNVLTNQTDLPREILRRRNPLGYFTGVYPACPMESVCPLFHRGETYLSFLFNWGVFHWG